MLKQRKLTILSVAVLLALLVSAALPFAALADDGVPPADVPVVDEVAPPIVDELLTVPEILDQLPEDTALVVVDQNGEALPLASVDASEVFAAPDPYFEISGVRYEFTALDCEPDTLGDQGCGNPIQAAFDYLTTNDLTPDSGLITVEAGTYTEDVTVDGSLWTTKPVSLTLIGENGSDYTILDGYFDLYNFSGDFYLTGFTINDYVSLEADGNVGVSDLFMDVNGLYVGSGGDTTLDDVTVRNNNDVGAAVYANGNVTVTGGDFSDNEFSGIYIESYYGDAVLTDVIATGNYYGNGASVFADGNVTVSGGDFSDNDYSGILSYSNGDTVLTDVDATWNDENGAIVITDGNATVSGGDFSYNDYSGIHIESYYGDAALTDVYATWNYGDGASIFADGNVIVSGGDFSDNDYSGIYIESYYGDAVLTDVNANGNYGDGASIFADGNVTVSGGDFSDNDYDGIYSYSKWDTVLTDVNATGNYGNGAFVFADGNVTVSGGNFSDNGIWGVESHSFEGDVTLNDVSAFGNGFGNFGNAKLAIVNNSTFYETGGAFVTSEFGNIKIVCGNYSGNNGAGLQFYSNGNTNLDGPVLEGNTQGYNWLPSENAEGTLSFGKCQVVKEDGERRFKPQKTDDEVLVCSGEKKVVLQAGDAYGMYENLCDIEFQLKELNEEKLPGALPSGATQLGGLDVQVISDGTAQSELPAGGKITLKFPIPAGTDEANLVVLFWNGLAWEVPGGEVVDGYYVVTVNEPGNYVLIAK